MTPKQTIYAAQAKAILKNIEIRGFEGHYCETKEEALELAMSLVKPGSSVSWGGSMTLDETKIMETLKSRDDITLIDRATAANPDELKAKLREAFSADYYFMSTNAITMAGELVNIDGTGGRVAALVYGPDNVIIVTGMNKVAANVEEAISRVRNIAAPPNAARLNKNTPCVVTGKCEDCYSLDCICSHTVVTRRCPVKGRIKLILVGEELGL